MKDAGPLAMTGKTMNRSSKGKRTLRQKIFKKFGQVKKLNFICNPGFNEYKELQSLLLTMLNSSSIYSNSLLLSEQLSYWEGNGPQEKQKAKQKKPAIITREQETNSICV